MEDIDISFNDNYEAFDSEDDDDSFKFTKNNANKITHDTGDAAVNIETKSEIIDDFIEDTDSGKHLSDENSSSVIDKDFKVIRKKLVRIADAVSSSNVSVLKEEAIKNGGLISDDVRRTVWPKIVGVDIFETSPRPSAKEIEEHPYFQQVILDVNRSLKRFPPSIAEQQRLAMQDQLVLLIMRVLIKNPDFHYYQGYHDICVTFLLVLGEEMAFNVVNKLSKTHLKDFMCKTFEPTIDILGYLNAIVRKEDSELFLFLERSDVGCVFSLSWLITWFGHVLNRYDDVARLFDFFLACHPWMPVYLSAAIVLHRKDEILKQSCDMASIHTLLTNIPDNLPFEELIVETRRLFAMYPPKQLEIEEEPVRQLRKKKELARRKRSRGFVYTILKTIQNKVPTSKLTISVVIAAAVVVYAVVYQSYKT